MQDQDDESIPEQTSRGTAVNSSNWRRTIIVIVITAIIAGTSDYLLGIRTDQNASQSAQGVSFQPSPIITAQSSVAAPSLSAEAGSWQTYANSEWQIRYPSDMTISVNQGQSIINPNVLITTVSLKGRDSDINIKTELNSGNLSIEDWLEERRKDEREHCQIDCFGFESQAKTITVADRRGLLQYLGSVVGTVNIYLPLNENTIIWISGSTERQLSPSLETRGLLISILNTLSVSKSKP
jgi:hypothetical protein